jgi:multicomponent Na+:H+ antiporter subunit D
LVTVAAASATAGFAVVGLAFTDCRSSEDGAAAQRILAFMALFAILTTAGAGAFLAEAKSVRFDQVGADNLGGVLLLAAFAILTGGPGAHVWMRDAAQRVPAFSAAYVLTALPLLGIYVLARAFPAEPILSVFGVLMALWGGMFALAADDLRHAFAYAAIALWGVTIALLGVSAPVALSGAAASAVVTAMGVLAAGLCLATAMEASGRVAAREFAMGLARPMPLTASLFGLAALSLIGWPGLAGFSAQGLALDAAADHGPVWLWPCLLAAIAALAGGFALRVTALLFAAPHLRNPPPVSVQPPLLAFAPCMAVILAFGAEPALLFNLLPPEPPLFDPIKPGGLVAALQLLAAGAAMWAVLRVVRIAPAGASLPDIDAFWRGPIAAVLSAVIGLLGAVQAAAGRHSENLAQKMGRHVGQGLSRFSSHRAVGFSAFVLIAMTIALTAFLYWAPINTTM